MLNFFKSCKRCAHEFLRGVDNCGTCGRGFEGYSLQTRRQKPRAFKKILGAFAADPESSFDERPLVRSLVDWRDPLVLRLVAIVAVIGVIASLLG